MKMKQKIINGLIKALFCIVDALMIAYFVYYDCPGLAFLFAIMIFITIAFIDYYKEES